MSQQSEFGAELTQDDAFIGDAPAGDANPGDYMSNDQQVVSEDTGTVYDSTGEPETTPHDEVLIKEEEEEIES
jgi:hypothetical protein